MKINQRVGWIGRTAAVAGFFVTMAISAGVAHAYAIDTKIGEISITPSSDAAELAGLEDILGLTPGTLTMDFKIDQSSLAFNYNVNPQPEGGWYIDVAPATPGYFALKFGTGGTTATANTFYFANIADFTKLVWTNEQVQFLTGGDCGAASTGACNITRLSHYAGYNGGDGGGGPGGGSAPEPGTLALVGLGLLGAVWSRQRRVS